MLSVLAPLEFTLGIQLDLRAEGSSCDRHCSSEGRKVPSSYACGERWGAALDPFLSVGNIRWDVSTRCTVWCRELLHGLWTARWLHQECSFEKRLVSLITHTYLRAHPALVLKGTSPWQLCRWQLSLALLHTPPAPNVSAPSAPPSQTLLPCHGSCKLLHRLFRFHHRLLLYAGSSSSNLQRRESQKNGMELFVVPVQ